MLAWAEKQDEIVGYDQFKWNGLTTLEVGNQLMRPINSDVRGLIHIYGEDITKYDLLNEINDVFERKKKIKIQTEIEEPVIVDRRLKSIRNFRQTEKTFRERAKELYDFIT